MSSFLDECRTKSSLSLGHYNVTPFIIDVGWDVCVCLSLKRLQPIINSKIQSVRLGPLCVCERGVLLHSICKDDISHPRWDTGLRWPSWICGSRVKKVTEVKKIIVRKYLEMDQTTVKPPTRDCSKCHQKVVFQKRWSVFRQRYIWLYQIEQLPQDDGLLLQVSLSSGGVSLADIDFRFVAHHLLDEIQNAIDFQMAILDL